MTSKTTYCCDVCKKPIEGEHAELYMATVIVHWTETISDGGIGTEQHTDAYHVHNDMSHHCMHKLWEILKKGK